MFGVMFKPDAAPFETLMLQIERSASDLRSVQTGVCAEVDGHMSYELVDSYEFDASTGVVCIGFDINAGSRIDQLEVQLPGPLSAEQSLLLKAFEQAFYVG